LEIKEIRTLVLNDRPNQLWLEIETDEGITGLGETFFGAQSVAAYVHTVAAPHLIGKNPLDIEGHARALKPRHGFRSNGAEIRGNSAIDIALWDLMGKTFDAPLHTCLGGASRNEIAVYNTCAGYNYLKPSVRLAQARSLDWGGTEQGPYDDLQAFLDTPEDLARSLIDEGYTAMKIWPFDRAAMKHGGQYIDREDLEAGIDIVRRIRKAGGDRIGIMMECHSLWNLPTAKRIARRLEEFDLEWLEDMVRPDDIGALAELSAFTSTPICASELMGTRHNYRDLLEARAASVVMIDLTWCGGPTEARKIAAMADTYSRPVTMHDCTGPVSFACGVHLSMHAPNAMLQEMTRAHYSSWYREVVDGLPLVENGRVMAPQSPGHGLSLSKDLRKNPGLEVQVTRQE